MCDHPFVCVKAGALYCEQCGLFLPAYPEQLAEREAARQEELRKAALAALDAQPTAAKAEWLDVPMTPGPSFASYTAPLLRALYPSSFAEEMIKVL